VLVEQRREWEAVAQQTGVKLGESDLHCPRPALFLDKEHWAARSKTLPMAPPRLTIPPAIPTSG
jgi:hypothetical protein